MTGVSTYGQALNQIGLIRDQQTLFTSLSIQLSTGKKGRSFSALGTDVLTSKRARADIRTLDTFVDNIKTADRRIQLSLNAIEEFKAQAESLYSQLINLPQESLLTAGEQAFFDDPLTPDIKKDVLYEAVTTPDPSLELASLQDIAGDVLNFFFDLLNVQDGDRYLLGGSQTGEAPIRNTGTLQSAVGGLISQWKGGGITTTELISDLQDRTATTTNPNALTDSIVGYSSSLSSGNVGNVFVRVDDNIEVDYTALANSQPFRDLLVVASYLSDPGLPPLADAYTPPNAPPAPADVPGAPGATLEEMKDNFFAVVNEMISMTSKAIDEIDKVRFKLEGSRARIDSIRKGHLEEKNLLQATVSDVEDVDLNEVAVSLNTLQIQLDASFRVTSRLQELSLVNFI